MVSWDFVWELVFVPTPILMHRVGIPSGGRIWNFLNHFCSEFDILYLCPPSKPVP